MAKSVEAPIAERKGAAFAALDAETPRDELIERIFKSRAICLVYRPPQERGLRNGPIYGVIAGRAQGAIECRHKGLKVRQRRGALDAYSIAFVGQLSRMTSGTIHADPWLHVALRGFPTQLRGFEIFVALRVDGEPERQRQAARIHMRQIAKFGDMRVVEKFVVIVWLFERQQP